LRWDTTALRLSSSERLALIRTGGYRPDIRNPELVNPLLLEFLFPT
jgi:hypothetical protein